MKYKFTKILVAAAAMLILAGATAQACSWAAYVNGQAAVAGRTMDWYYTDQAVIKGHGQGVVVKAADTANALEYTAKYASIQIHSFEAGVIADAINEKGLQGSLLYLDRSTLPAPQEGRKDINPYEFLSYAVSNFATVNEVVDSLGTLNFLPAANVLSGPDGKKLANKPENWPFHFAFADTSGDKAIIEFVDGKMEVYHDKTEDALSNEPFYIVHRTLEAFGYQPNGSISTIDRRARAKLYLNDMHERKVNTSERALMAMRGLLASVFAGTEEIDRTSNNEVYPTQWWTLIDMKAKKYYFTRIESWCAEIYDFSMFAPDQPTVSTLKAAECPYPAIELEKSAAKK